MLNHDGSILTAGEVDTLSSNIVFHMLMLIFQEQFQGRAIDQNWGKPTGGIWGISRKQTPLRVMANVKGLGNCLCL
jgi:hypothetical protein